MLKENKDTDQSAECTGIDAVIRDENGLVLAIATLKNNCFSCLIHLVRTNVIATWFYMF